MSAVKVLMLVHRTVLILLEATLAPVNLGIGWPMTDFGVQVCNSLLSYVDLVLKLNFCDCRY